MTQGKFTYSNVMSTIAVFLALGGGGFAVAAAVKKDSVGTKQVKNESLLSEDLKNGQAVDAEDLVPEEDTHIVGTAGEPAFSNGGEGDCVVSDFAAQLAIGNRVGFYRSASGRVHLQGILRYSDNAGSGDGLCDQTSIAEGFEDGLAFILPPAYRPEKLESIGVSGGGYTGGLFVGGEEDTNYGGQAIIPAGAVIVNSSQPSVPAPGPLDFAFITGISFRAGDGIVGKAVQVDRSALRQLLEAN